MKRRLFVQQAGAAVAAGWGFPAILKGVEDKHPVIGEGDFRFSVDHQWGRLPEGHTYGGASHGVAFDSQGNVYISHTGGPGSVFVFDPEGKFIKSLAPQHQGNGHGLDIRTEGGVDFIYLSPNTPKNAPAPLKATKMTLDGEVVWEGGPPAESHRYDHGEPFNLTNTSFCPDGGWHVGDGYGSHFLHRYDKDGRYVASFGGKGKEPGQFATPHGHWFDDREGVDQLVVCDRANARLQRMTLDGEPLSLVAGIESPASLDIRGEVMVCTEIFIGRVAFLNRKHEVIARLSDDAGWNKLVKETKGFRTLANKSQWKAGKFVHPHDATFDRDGNLFIAEWVEGGRVSKLTKV
jgi:hypothetical protein